MKKIFFIIILFSFTSCKKAGQCYTCTFGTVNGYTPPSEEYCGKMPYTKKINGEDVQTYCQPK